MPKTATHRLFSSHRRPVPRRTTSPVPGATGSSPCGAVGGRVRHRRHGFVAMGLLPYIAADFGRSEAGIRRGDLMYALGVIVARPADHGADGIRAAPPDAPAAHGGVHHRQRLRRWLGGLARLLRRGDGLRFIAGIPHGAYFSVAALVAASLAAPGKRGRAVALSGMGLSVATVAGVPAAQALGQQFGWRSAFALVAVIGVAALIALWFAVPHMNRGHRPRWRLSALATPQVWFTVAIGTVGFGGMFAVYTYITWTMTEVGGFAGA